MKKLLTALIFTLATAAGAGDLEDGASAARKGDYKTDFCFHKKAAEQGDSDVQYNLALMYRKGQGALQNDADYEKLLSLKLVA